jgi:hypothetical protein
MAMSNLIVKVARDTGISNISVSRSSYTALTITLGIHVSEEGSGSRSAEVTSGAFRNTEIQVQREQFTIADDNDIGLCPISYGFGLGSR